MEVRLKGQPNSVTLVEVERDDDEAVIGTTNTGKRFVARRDRIAGPLAARHPYRIYLKNGMVIRVIDPAFEEVEQFYLADQDEPITVVLDDGEGYAIQADVILSILSASPEDERVARSEANGHAGVGVVGEDDGQYEDE